MSLEYTATKRAGSLNNRLVWSGHVFMFFLLFMSVYFYAERALFYDSAFQFFKLINTESYNIEADRWSAILVQSLPLLAIKLGFSLKSILILGSFSYVFIGYLVFIINTYVLRNTVAGIAVLFLYTACIRESFFYCVTELPVGMLFVTTFYAWLFYPHKTGKHVPIILYVSVAVCILLVCFFFHPMTFFPVIFIIGFYLLHTKKYTSPALISILLFTLLIYTSKMFFTSSDSYEGNLFSQLTDAPMLLMHLFSLDSTSFFAHRFFSLYLICNILSCLVAAYYAATKKWLLLTWFLLNYGGFLLVCFITFNKGDSHVAMEKYFMPVSFLIAIPFLHEIVSAKRFKLIGFAICFVVFSRGVYGIWYASDYFTKRLAYVDRLISVAQAHSANKLVVFKEDINENYTTWACALETLLRSATNKNLPQTTVYLIHKNELAEMDLSSPTLFLYVPFDRNFNIDALNKHYFKLPLAPYVINHNPIPEQGQ